MDDTPREAKKVPTSIAPLFPQSDKLTSRSDERKLSHPSLDPVRIRLGQRLETGDRPARNTALEIEERLGGFDLRVRRVVKFGEMACGFVGEDVTVDDME